MKSFDVLLVEDEYDLLTFLHNSLVRSGYNVLSFQDAESALKTIDDVKFRILITDIKLPDMDGIALAKMLIAKHSDLNIIFITGFNAYATDAKNLFPNQDTFSKPFHLKSLIAKIDSIYSKQVMFSINDDNEEDPV